MLLCNTIAGGHTFISILTYSGKYNIIVKKLLSMLLCNTIAITSGYIFFSILTYSGKMHS